VELLSRFKPWREGVGWRRGLQVYGTITAVYLVIALVLMVRSYSLGNTAGLDTLLSIIGTAPISILAWLALLPYVDGGALSEELGWRGYALPRLMESMRTPLTAAIVLGVLWGLWHMPRDLPVFLSGAAAFEARFGGIGGYLIEWTNFILGTIGSTILCAYVFNLTGGSVIAPILVHGASNTIKVNILRFTGDRNFEWHGLQVDITDLFALPLVLAVLLLAGPQLGRRPRHRD
jgi:membrane protease YdiL (CAAX protease family)